MQFRLSRDGTLTIDIRARHVREALQMVVQGMFSWTPSDHPIKQPGAREKALDLLDALDSGNLKDIEYWPNK